MGKRLTYNEVKSKIESRNGCKLLSEEYVVSKEKLSILCGICNKSFEMSFEVYKRSKGMCQICSAPKSKLDIEFVREYIEDYGCKLLSDSFEKVDGELGITCKECGEEYMTNFLKFKKGKHTCNSCSYKKMGKNRRCDYNYVKSVIQRDGCTLLSKEYDKSTTKMSIKCHCGNIFTNNFNEFQMKDIGQCQECGRKDTKRVYDVVTYDEVRQYIEIDSETRCKLISDKCDGVVDEIDIMCGCGGIFTTKFSRFKEGKTKCNDCTGYKRWDINSVKEYVFMNTDCTLLSDAYINFDDKMEFRCGCGEIFITSFDVFSRGSGNKQLCDRCSGKSSKSERKAVDLFEHKNVLYEEQKTFDDCRNNKTNYPLKYDFFLPAYNTLIECDGEQHYKPVDFAGKGEKWAINNLKDIQHRDNIKNQYALTNNINLIRIPYWELDNIENILNETIKTLELERAM